MEKTGSGNFLPYANLGTMGQPKRPPTYRRTDSIRADDSQDGGMRIVRIDLLNLAWGHADFTVLLAAAKSRMLGPSAFDEYCRFDTSAFF